MVVFAQRQTHAHVPTAGSEQIAQHRLAHRHAVMVGTAHHPTLAHVLVSGRVTIAARRFVIRRVHSPSTQLPLTSLVIALCPTLASVLLNGVATTAASLSACKVL